MRLDDLKVNEYFVVFSKGNNYLYQLLSDQQATGDITIDIALIDTTCKEDKYFIGDSFTVMFYDTPCIVDHSLDKNDLCRRYMRDQIIRIVI